MLEDREQAFEAKFKNDQELKFKIEARLAKLFGQWVGEQMGLTAERIAEYGQNMVAAQLEEAGNQDIINRAMADLTAAGKTITKEMLETKVAQFESIARDQLLKA